MPFNLTKKYPQLLEFVGYNEYERKESLIRIYKRDVEDNTDFKFRGKQIYPIKSEGQIDMDRTFTHLTTVEETPVDEDGNELPKRRIFDGDRSKRLHWINYHVHELSPDNIEIFSVIERDISARKDVQRTYIYDKVEKYVIVFECQRGRGYYLLTAYYLNKPWAEKSLKKKKKKKLPNIL